MKFSVCIPNYNYQSYLDKTLDSVLRNNSVDMEILISDNASTDQSVPIIQTYQKVHANIHLKVNATNLGFAANLDCAASMATGEYVNMLSSDDIMTSDALFTYDEVLHDNKDSIVCSSWDIIDSEGTVTGFNGPNKKLWFVEDRDEPLSRQLKCDVFRVKSSELLRRCLLNMATPFNFCTVTYRRDWYAEIGGYGGGRLINPDKWFHWKLLTVATDAIFIDKALFQYRWHSQNQTTQQSNSGHLKYLLDEYRNIIELSDEMLRNAELSKNEVQKSFVKRDIYRHGLGEFTKGRWLKSLRIFLFGLSSFPGLMIRRPYFIFYLLFLLTTPVGSKLTSLIFRRA